MSDTREVAMGKPTWWWPERTDDKWLARIRADYPEDAHLPDESLREKYADGAKYANLGLWDHKGDAYDDFRKLADAFFGIRDDRDQMSEALERILTECESEAMSCDCAPPGNGEACPRCEIAFVAREALRGGDDAR